MEQSTFGCHRFRLSPPLSPTTSSLIFDHYHLNQYHPININELSDSILALIFDHLPVEDLLIIGDVCDRWKVAQEQACRRRKSLCLMGPYSKYTTVSLYAHYGIYYDQHNCYRFGNAELNSRFCSFLARTFPNITRFEFCSHSDAQIFNFLTRLFSSEGSEIQLQQQSKFTTSNWLHNLTTLKVIIGPLSYPINRDDEDDDFEFMMRIQNHFYSWNDLLEDINFAQFAPKLKYLTLYNANVFRDFRNITLNIIENFSNLTNLEELYFGVQCDNIADIVTKLRHLKHLKKFVIFDDDVHLAQEMNIRDDLAAVDSGLMQQLTELCLVYGNEEPEADLFCIDIITERCTSLIDLHLFCSDISFTELFPKLARLEHLEHLRLSGFYQSFLYSGKSFSDDIPPLRTVHTLHLNTNRLINYSHLRPLVEMCLPNLQTIQQDCLSGLYFMDDFLFPEEDPYADDVENSGQLVVLPPEKRIQAEVERYQNMINRSTANTKTTRYHRKTSLANAQLESASLICFEQLFPLLNRYSKLKHLLMESPADNFSFLGENIVPLPPSQSYFTVQENKVAISHSDATALSTLKTLHLDCSSTGELPCSRKFPQTARYWPKVQLLKLEGLKAKLNYFYDLSPSEYEFLYALKNQFKHLRKVLLMKNCKSQLRKNQLMIHDWCSSLSSSPTSSSQSDQKLDQKSKDITGFTTDRDVNFYSVRYMMYRDDGDVIPKLMLMIGQKIVF